MSTETRRLPPAAARRGPGPMMNMGMPGEKSMNFRGSAKRFLREMRSERAPMALIVVLAIASVVLAVIGPKLLGDATNIIFDGVIGTQLGSAFPAGTTTDAIASTTMTAMGARSERISRRNLAADPRKFIDFSPGMPMFIIGPGPRRAAAGGSRRVSVLMLPPPR